MNRVALLLACMCLMSFAHAQQVVSEGNEDMFAIQGTPIIPEVVSQNLTNWGNDEAFHQQLLQNGVNGKFLATVETFLQNRGYLFSGAKITKADTAHPSYKNLTVQVRYEITGPMIHPCAPGIPCPPPPARQWFSVEMTGLIQVINQGTDEIVRLNSVKGSAQLDRR